MAITVQEALQISSLRNAKLLGGQQGLNNKIRFVNVMEILEVTKWIKGGELLITTGFHFKNDSGTRRRIIYDLAEKNVAAFGIKPGPYLEKVPEDMIDHADRAGLPLLELDPGVAYSEIMVQLFEILLNHQLHRLKRTEQIHNKLIEDLLTSSGLASICQTLAEFENNPVFITGKSGNLLSSAVPVSMQPQLDEEWENEVLECLKDSRIQMFSLNPHRWHRITLQLSDAGQDIILVPIKINDAMVVGNLVILEKSRQLDDIDLMAIEHSSTIIALEFVKEKAVLETECQIRGELLGDIIDGNYKSEEELIRRADNLQFNLNTDLTVFVIGINHLDSLHSGQKKRDDKRVLGIKSEMLQLVRNVFSSYPSGSMFLGKSDSIIGLIQQSSKEQTRILPEKLAEVVKKIKVKLPKVKFTIGLGRIYNGVLNISKSYEEAVAAMRIGEFMNGQCNITYFEELGPYRFLFELKDLTMVRSFYNDYIGKITAYDQQNNTELLETLISYFKNDCSLNRTAESLYIHKNSVIYRIKKIEEISGLNVNNSDERFSLQLCLKFGQLLNERFLG